MSYLKSPNFAFDCIYLHEKISPKNSVQVEFILLSNKTSKFQ